MVRTIDGMSRRAVLTGLIAAPFILRPAEAASNARGVSLHHAVTKETIAATYWRNGEYDPGAWKEINHFMRDWHTDEAALMDLRALDIVHAVCERVGAKGKAQILCGYRSPATNARLRRVGVAARKSYHVKGRAIDFRIPDSKIREMRQAALDLKAGGVGYYPRRNFLHVDNGPVRSWRR